MALRLPITRDLPLSEQFHPTPIGVGTYYRNQRLLGPQQSQYIN